jgi:hypothetical protein
MSHALEIEDALALFKTQVAGGAAKGYIGGRLLK